jgi:hypothetical protein
MLQHYERSRPIAVDPPCTFSPIFTKISTSNGKSRSTRDPKRMRPKRSPLLTLSPGFLQHTIRRAINPAIWVTRYRLPPSCIHRQLRSFSSDARWLNAARNFPLVYWISVMTPSEGILLICTLNTERKMLTRWKLVPDSSLIGPILTTVPSAGDTSREGSTGMVLSGSRKKNAEKEPKRMNIGTRKTGKRPIMPQAAAAPKQMTTKGIPSLCILIVTNKRRFIRQASKRNLCRRYCART